MSNTVIGIDLGTTNSCLAFISGGKPVIIENKEGKRTTPSVVCYQKSGEIAVGDPAKRQMITAPKNTIYEAKRLIGKKFNHPDVQRIKKTLPFEIMSSKNGDAWIRIEKKDFAPQQISAQVLQYLKECAESFLGHPVTEAVITVPAYFDDVQRQATKDAGRIAGLEVKRIINEPTAAALAYGLDKNTKNDAKVIVYDLGGGTFDVSLIKIIQIEGEKQFEVMATNGNTALGGGDFDQKIIEYLVNEFKKEQGVDLTKDSLALQRLKEAAEKAKIELSSAQETVINLPYITADSVGPKHMDMRLTRSKLEGLVEELAQSTLDPCKVVLKDAQLKAQDVDVVVLVGGQTRMPKIEQLVRAFFGKDPVKGINPDEAVALGAAVQAGIISGNVKDVLLLDVTPLSLGIETLGGVMTKLIEKNTTIPTNKKQVFSTAADNQPTVTIRVLQGEREQAAHNRSLGQFDLEGINPAPRGVPQIEVQFNIDANGILNVSAKDVATNKQQSIVVKSNSGLNDAEIEKMIQDAQANAQEDEKFSALVKTRNEADALINMSEKLVPSVKDDEDKKKLQDAIAELKSTYSQGEKEQIEEKMTALRSEYDQISVKNQNQSQAENDVSEKPEEK